MTNSILTRRLLAENALYLLFFQNDSEIFLLHSLSHSFRNNFNNLFIHSFINHLFSKIFVHSLLFIHLLFHSCIELLSYLFLLRLQVSFIRGGLVPRSFDMCTHSAYTSQEV